MNKLSIEGNDLWKLLDKRGEATFFPTIVTIDKGKIIDVELFSDKQSVFDRLEAIDSKYGTVRNENGHVDADKCEFDPMNGAHYVYSVFRKGY